MTEHVINLFGGPGGWEEGARAIGADIRIVGYDIDKDACATARAAGHIRHQSDVSSLNPSDFPDVTGAILSPPCPPWSQSGLRKGIDDYQTVLDAITHAGSAQWQLEEDELVPGCGCDWDEIANELAGLTDPRTRLTAETIRFALWLPRLEWLVVEQVPALRLMWEDIAAELFAAGWQWVDVARLNAVDYGLPSRRDRVYLAAHRYRPGHLPRPPRDAPTTSMATALGWPAGHRINTRGTRRTSGGNEFSADGPSWCLTSKARSWRRVTDGRRLTAAEAGQLVGFRPDYPWHGSRTKQFLQIADVVSPVMAAAVLAGVPGIAHTHRETTPTVSTAITGGIAQPGQAD
jgi:DNA (cytosine-5)-methyltransferase 1